MYKFGYYSGKFGLIRKSSVVVFVGVYGVLERVLERLNSDLFGFVLDMKKLPLSLNYKLKEYYHDTKSFKDGQKEHISN